MKCFLGPFIDLRGPPRGYKETALIDITDGRELSSMRQLAHVIESAHRARAGIRRPIGMNRYYVSATMKVTQISDVIHSTYLPILF